MCYDGLSAAYHDLRVPLVQRIRPLHGFHLRPRQALFLHRPAFPGPILQSRATLRFRRRCHAVCLLLHGGFGVHAARKPPARRWTPRPPEGCPPRATTGDLSAAQHSTCWRSNTDRIAHQRRDCADYFHSGAPERDRTQDLRRPTLSNQVAVRISDSYVRRFCTLPCRDANRILVTIRWGRESSIGRSRAS